MVKNKKSKKTKNSKNSQKKVNRKKQMLQENKILRNFLLGIGILAAASLVFYFAIDNVRNFEYEGVEFQTVKFCDAKPCLILYQTKLPVITSQGEKAEYNFYLRNDPRDLGEIIFDGDINILSNMVIDSKEEFSCNGDGGLAMANLVKLYEVIGTNVVKNEKLDCDLGNEYIYLDIQEGSETKIIQAVQSCYVLRINDCEILEGTERFMLETFIEVNKILKNGS